MDFAEYNPYSPPNDDASQDKHNITALLEAYASLSVPRLLDLLAVDFTHVVLPRSLGMPTRDKAAFVQHAAGIFSVFESFRMIPVGMLRAAGWKETWVVRANMEGVLKGGKGQWKNECMMIVRMDDDGMFVEEIQEFVDSAKAVEMMRQHAPKSFGAEAPQSMTIGEGNSIPAASLLTTFCWFLVCVLVAKLGAQVLALVIFWAHPTLEVFRRSFFATPGRQRL
ncbi:hypothetical protein NKR19_g6655 [Coniochaeta hoffmannii]|uniref:SnoaL-like domain-containing protein n=1 Tax=Coniochaeta hoffmannii TaxID=91930 RepID=A0AA38RQ90_9PEZI|nr:hypothetical protein NKR19_g6655 [Coniochaeta hoffmannii]